MVNAGGDVVMGFSGSHSGQYAAAYYTGRLADDPPGEMAPPALLKIGEASYNLIDGSSRNRWGDYSLCSLDPTDEQTFWTIQEYAQSHNGSGENRWGTWIGPGHWFNCWSCGSLSWDLCPARGSTYHRSRRSQPAMSA